MNREEALEDLVETLECWPSHCVDHDGYGRWSWHRDGNAISFVHSVSSPITEQDWERARNTPIPPMIPKGAERVTIVKGKVVYLKHDKHRVWQNVGIGEWVNILELDEAVKLWDSASTIAKPPSALTIPDDAELAKQFKDAGLHGDTLKIEQLYNINRPCVDPTTPNDLDSFHDLDVEAVKLAEQFNSEVLGSVRTIHPNVIAFAKWMMKELNRAKR